MMQGRVGSMLAMLVIGAGWGLGVPLWKIAAQTGHSALGLTLWQTVIAALVLGPVALARGGLRLDRATILFCAVLGLLGSLLPNVLSYLALAGLDAGVLAITLATVPMLTLVLAALLGLDRPRPRRLAGVALGFLAVALIAAPDSLPQAGIGPFLVLAVLAALCYAAEANWITLRQPDGLDPVSALFGASVAAVLLGLPWAVATGHVVSPLRPWGAGEWALTAVSVLSAACYAGYVWLVRRAGPVYAAQVGYVVTLSGVFWSVLLLGERYAGPVWMALGLMVAGLALVTPALPRRGGAAGDHAA
ncbi:MAG: DMT family transporter [Alphaproteobacteria bacterium]|nr:MAG: DMT family transporter [Alphaproteobacteria bacterium]